MSLLARSSRRHLLTHPWQTALAVAGVALGVAVVVSIDLANASATRAFDLAAESVGGRATHRVVGGPGGVPDDLFRRLVVDLAVEPAAPVVEGWAVRPATEGGNRVLRLLGVDPLSEAPFRPYLGGLSTGGGGRLGAFLTEPGAALLSEETAVSLGMEVGDELPVSVEAAPHTLRLVGLLTPRDELSRQALRDLAVVDVATAQELLGRQGTLSRIELRLPEEDAGDEARRRIAAALPPGTRLEPAGDNARTRGEMTRAFRFNLTALSLLALVCGLFLIYNSISFSVVQRRTLLGTLRALGVTRRQVFALLLGEAAAVAALGSAVGCALGIVLGRGMLGLVTRTVNDLYFTLAVTRLEVTPIVLLKAAALGFGATLAAAAVPAREATSVPPRAALTRSLLESGTRRALPRLAVFAAALLVLAAACLAWPSRALMPGFVGLFALLVGLALLAPLATVGLMRGVAPLAGRLFGILGSMAARGVEASLSRTGVAIAALAVAVSVTVGVGVMIDSFRGTVERWLDGALSADLYLSPADAPAGSAAFDSAPLDRALATKLAAVEGVEHVSSVRRAEVGLAGDEPSRLVAVDSTRDGFLALDARAGDLAAAWTAFAAGDGVLISEPYAWHRGLSVGDAVPLPTDRGVHEFPVLAVYASYASDRGVVLMSRSGWDRFWDDTALSGLSVDLAPGADADAVIPRLRSAAGSAHRLVIQSSRQLTTASLAIFDRTFLITGVLRLLAGAVAFIGVLSALMALQLERSRELGVLRANGLTPRQVWRLVTSQTALMGLAAGLLSLPVGLALAAVMIHVINRRSFGWTLDMVVDPAILGQAVLLALAAALLAGLYPAWRMSRTPPARALREE